MVGRGGRVPRGPRTLTRFSTDRQKRRKVTKPDGRIRFMELTTRFPGDSSRSVLPSAGSSDLLEQRGAIHHRPGIHYGRFGAAPPAGGPLEVPGLAREVALGPFTLGHSCFRGRVASVLGAAPARAANRMGRGR